MHLFAIRVLHGVSRWYHCITRAGCLAAVEVVVPSCTLSWEQVPFVTVYGIVCARAHTFCL